MESRMIFYSHYLLMRDESAHSMLIVDLLTGYAPNHRANLNKVPYAMMKRLNEFIVQT